MSKKKKGKKKELPLAVKVEDLKEELSEWQRLNQEYQEQEAQAESKNIEESPEEGAEESPEESGESNEGSSLSLVDGDFLEKEKKKRKKEKEEREKLEKGHLLRVFPVLLVASLMALSSLYFLTPYSKLHDFQVSGNQEVKTQDLLAATGVKAEDYTLTTYLNLKDYEKKMQASSPWLKSVGIHYRFPTIFEVEVEEYQVVAYTSSNDQLYPVLSNGVELTSPVASDKLPESYIKLEFSDKPMLREFTQQLKKLPKDIAEQIHLIQHTPSKATEDLMTLTMSDGNQVLVPLSEMAKKLSYYSSIQGQLTPPSMVDMEVGIYSYANLPKSTEEEGAETRSQQEEETALESNSQ